jgi:uncharacterized protein (TIGR00369 family)
VTALSPRAAVPFYVCGPERFLHIEGFRGTAQGASGTMRTGPWVCDGTGTPSPGTLGILADSLWNSAAITCRPGATWGVATELSLSFGARLPADGSLLTAHAAVTFHDDRCAVAVGSITAADGRALVNGTTRTRFVPGIAEPDPVLLPPHDPGAAGIVEWLGLAFSPDGRTAQMDATVPFANPARNVHGGVLFCASELTASRAVAANTNGLTVSSMTILYLRGVPIGERLAYEVEVVHRGRTSAAASVRCHRADGRTAALATVNFGPAAGEGRP